MDSISKSIKWFLSILVPLVLIFNFILSFFLFLFVTDTFYVLFSIKSFISCVARAHFVVNALIRVDGFSASSILAVSEFIRNICEVICEAYSSHWRFQRPPFRFTVNAAYIVSDLLNRNVCAGRTKHQRCSVDVSRKSQFIWKHFDLCV